MHIFKSRISSKGIMNDKLKKWIEKRVNSSKKETDGHRNNKKNKGHKDLDNVVIEITL